VISLRRQHGSFRDQRQWMLLVAMVAAMTQSETIVFACCRNDLALVSGHAWLIPAK
jgi:hypothetical protein